MSIVRQGSDEEDKFEKIAVRILEGLVLLLELPQLVVWIIVGIFLVTGGWFFGR